MNQCCTPTCICTSLYQRMYFFFLFQKQKYFSHLLVSTSFGYYWGITDIGLGTRSSEMVL